MAPVYLPSYVVVFGDKHTVGSLKAFASDGLSQGPLLRIWVFLVFLTVGFFLGFWQMLSFGCEFLVYFVVDFSARALGAGFRPGVFSPTVSTTSTMGWNGWKFVAAISLGMRAIFVLTTSAFGLS